MTLDDFMSMTESRLPTAEEVVALCHDLGIDFCVVDGKPVLKNKTENRQEALAIAGLIRREPWRTEILKAKGLMS